MVRYFALIRKDSNSDYGVDFPDLPGCVSAGKTLIEAVSLAEEALFFHLEGMVEDNDDLPAASSLEAIVSKRSNSGKDVVTSILVSVPHPLGKHQRIQITVPKLVLRHMDAFAPEHGFDSRSAFLTHAAVKCMEVDRPARGARFRGKNPDKKKRRTEKT